MAALVSGNFGLIFDTFLVFITVNIKKIIINTSKEFLMEETFQYSNTVFVLVWICCMLSNDTIIWSIFSSQQLFHWLQVLAPRPTRISRQAAFRSVIWSAMVSPVNPGTRLANSTILIMHLVASSLNLSHRPRSSLTRWSALEFCSTHANTHKQRGGTSDK